MNQYFAERWYQVNIYHFICQHFSTAHFPENFLFQGSIRRQHVGVLKSLSLYLLQFLINQAVDYNVDIKECFFLWAFWYFPQEGSEKSLARTSRSRVALLVKKHAGWDIQVICLTGIILFSLSSETLTLLFVYVDFKNMP